MPVPGAGRVAHDVACPDDMHTVIVGDHADPVHEDQMLAVVVLVRHGSSSRTEMHRQRAEAWQLAWQLLDPHVVRVVEQRPELVGNRIPTHGCGRAELVHGFPDPEFADAPKRRFIPIAAPAGLRGRDRPSCTRRRAENVRPKAELVRTLPRSITCPVPPGTRYRRPRILS